MGEVPEMDLKQIQTKLNIQLHFEKKRIADTTVSASTWPASSLGADKAQSWQ